MKILPLLASLLTFTSLSGSPIPGFPHIFTKGSAEKGVAPDTATVTFTVIDFQAKSADAVNQTLKSYPPIAQLIFKTDLVRNVDSYFRNSKIDEIRLDLFAEACTAARKKASALAKAAGVTIDRVYAVSPEGEDYYFMKSSSRAFSLSASSADDDSDPPLFVPATIQIDATITMLFRLTGK
ncbi:MAG: SIMPL domain-containing protein [Akkermansiaceae bacterium]|jgi:uncharacterized protein YggE